MDVKHCLVVVECLLSFTALVACTSNNNTAASGTGGRTGGTAGTTGISGQGGATISSGGANTGGSPGTGGTSGASTGGVGSGGLTSPGGATSGGTTSGGATSTGGVGAGGTTRSGGASSGGSTTSGGASSGGTTSSGGATRIGGTTASAGSSATGGAVGTGGSRSTCGTTNTYDQVVLCDHPVAYWAINKSPSGSEPDLSGNRNTGTYEGGTPSPVSMPNGDQAGDFDGASQYLTIPSNASMSIPTTGNLTWEGWIRPDVLQFPHDDGSSGYVDWMGKCEQYGPTCEWEARMYDTNTTESPNRPNRISAYVFNPSAGLGSAADWQPVAGLIQAGQWYHVVGEYTTLSQPSDCANAASYPGSISIWVNGVQWNHSYHGQTGCMSQYNVVPIANNSALNIGTMALDCWFRGAIGKVAIYNFPLSQTQISNHYQVMTGKLPTGSCVDTCSF